MISDEPRDEEKEKTSAVIRHLRGNMIEVLHVTLMKAMLVFKLFIFNANNSFGSRSS